MMLNLGNHQNILAWSVVRWNMSQGTQVKVTLNDLGDVVLLDKGMSASSLVNMLRQRRNQQHESWRPTSDSSLSGTTYLKALDRPILNQSHEGLVIKMAKVAFLVYFWPKTMFVLFPSATFVREITEPLRKIEIRINYQFSYLIIALEVRIILCHTFSFKNVYSEI